jgi:metal-responsive CopG/Arc/MetJ family transcriptional regulator
MVLKQINLTLPSTLQKALEDYADKFGYKNIQEVASEALRDKVFFQNEYDRDITEKERDIIDTFIDITLKNKSLLSTEEELDKVLLS